jgi:hypothetical protein
LTELPRSDKKHQKPIRPYDLMIQYRFSAKTTEAAFRSSYNSELVKLVLCKLQTIGGIEGKPQVSPETVF